MSKHHEIIIKTANESNHQLQLDPADTVIVKKFDTVSWRIAAPNVESFRIERKPGSDLIFMSSDAPQRRHGRGSRGRIHPMAPKGAEYDYWIYWKAYNSDVEHPFDPKIAVDPDKDHSEKWLIGVVLGLFGLLTVGYLRRKNIKSKFRKKLVQPN